MRNGFPSTHTHTPHRYRIPGTVKYCPLRWGIESSPSSLRLAILIEVRAIPLVVVYLNAGPVSPQLKLSLRTHSATNLDHPVQHRQLFIRVYTDTSKTLSAALLTDGMSGGRASTGTEGAPSGVARRSFCTAPTPTEQLLTGSLSPLSSGLAMLWLVLARMVCLRLLGRL